MFLQYTIYQPTKIISIASVKSLTNPGISASIDGEVEAISFRYPSSAKYVRVSISRFCPL